MLKNICNKIIGIFTFDKYETETYLKNYIICQFGAFDKHNVFDLSEPFYSKLIECSKPFIKQNSSVLDIGCATGRLNFEFEKLGAGESVGIYTSKKFIDFCNLAKLGKVNLGKFEIKKHMNTLFLKRDILDMTDFEDEKFDFISCVNVIDRVLDPLRMVGNIYSLLKKDGVVMFVTPYDWVLSPVSKEKYFFDMKILFDKNKWQVIKEIRDISYVVPVNNKDYRVTKEYICHMVILSKIG